jgi:hypothetical protein
MTDWTLSDFQEMQVVRYDDVARIIVDYWEGDGNKPVHLIGFYGDASLTDFEIREEGFNHYQKLMSAMMSPVCRNCKNWDPNINDTYRSCINWQVSYKECGYR